MTTHKYGIEEREAKNNHGTCWVDAGGRLRAADRQRMTLQRFARERFKTVLVPGQMAPDGSFPLEMKRTKPYGYSLFNLDAFATICRDPVDAGRQPLDLRRCRTAAGCARRVARSWRRTSATRRRGRCRRDVMYDAEWPMRHASLLFAGLALDRGRRTSNLWTMLRAEAEVDEVVRNFFIRQPVLWLAPPRR